MSGADELLHWLSFRILRYTAEYTVTCIKSHTGVQGMIFPMFITLLYIIYMGKSILGPQFVWCFTSPFVTIIDISATRLKPRNRDKSLLFYRYPRGSFRSYRPIGSLIHLTVFDKPDGIHWYPCPPVNTHVIWYKWLGLYYYTKTNLKYKLNVLVTLSR